MSWVTLSLHRYERCMQDILTKGFKWLSCRGILPFFIPLRLLLFLSSHLSCISSFHPVSLKYLPSRGRSLIRISIMCPTVDLCKVINGRHESFRRPMQLLVLYSLPQD